MSEMNAFDKISVGSYVCLANTQQKGVVKFIGSVKNKQGRWAGIELDAKGTGKNSGTINGVCYFTVLHPNSGLFVPLANLIKIPKSPLQSSNRTSQDRQILSPRPKAVSTPSLSDYVKKTEKRLSYKNFEEFSDDEINSKNSVLDKSDSSTEVLADATAPWLIEAHEQNVREIEKFEHALNLLEKENNDLASKIINLESRIDAKETKTQEIQTETHVEILDAQIEELKKQENDRNTIQKLLAEKNIISAALAETEKNLVQKNKEIMVLQGQMLAIESARSKEFEASLKNVAEISDLKAKIAELESKISANSSENIVELMAKLQIAEAARDAATSDVIKVKEELETFKARNKKAMAQYLESIDLLMGDMAKLQSEKKHKKLTRSSAVVFTTMNSFKELAE